MTAESDLQRTIRDLEKSYDQAKSDNDAIQTQIDSLETALSFAKLAESRAESLERSVKSFDVPSKWVKGYREPFDAALRGSLKTSTDDYERSVQSLRESIEKKIWDLRLKKNYAVSLFSTLEKQINKAWKELNSLGSD